MASRGGELWIQQGKHMYVNACCCHVCTHVRACPICNPGCWRAYRPVINCHNAFASFHNLSTTYGPLMRRPWHHMSATTSAPPMAPNLGAAHGTTPQHCSWHGISVTTPAPPMAPHLCSWQAAAKGLYTRNDCGSQQQISQPSMHKCQPEARSQAIALACCLAVQHLMPGCR